LAALSIFIFSTTFLIPKPGIGQQNNGRPQRPEVAILLPLQLDSLYKFDQFRYGNSIPKFALPYLEFYNGVMLAVDSLRMEGVAANIHLVDSRMAGAPYTIWMDEGVKKSNILIGVAQNTTDLKAMSEFAKAKQIPFLSATYPNDGGIKDNPNMVLLNSTLRTHCLAMYRFLQSNHAIDNIVMFTKSGPVETYVKTVFDEAARTTPSIKLKIKTITLTDSFGVAELQPLLDSNRQNLVMGATLDLVFAQRLVKNIALLKPYPCTVTGMPNWDEIDLKKPEFKGVDVIFSTPFISSSGNIDVYNSLVKNYANKQNSKPSDMAVKGFEITYKAVKTIAQWPDAKSFINHFNDKTTKVFTEFDIQPEIDPQSPEVIQHYENKKLYFIKKTDGVLKGVY
jgi:hypothetical protein